MATPDSFHENGLEGQRRENRGHRSAIRRMSDCRLQIVQCKRDSSDRRLETSDLWMRPFLKYWLPVMVWLGLLAPPISCRPSTRRVFWCRFCAGSIRKFRGERSIPHTIIRKLGHLTEYAILAALFWRALRGAHWRSKMSLLFAAAWGACAIFAATDEFHQSFVPSRTASANDVMIDVCGALIGLTICVALASRKVVKEKCV